jgi:molybdopterin-guanine dinucleotide biosynthesis protein A
LDVSCIVLAGGKSTRLGRNKVVERLGDQSLIERVVSRLSVFKSEIIIVTAKKSSLPELPNYPELKIIKDIYPDKGSLGGIYSGLVISTTFHNLVVACDMPFLNLDLISYMVGLSEGYDVVIPKTDNDILEPLHALYSRSCISSMQFLIEQNRLSILELFPMVRVKYIQREEIDKLDPGHLSFFNINTESDLLKGKDLLKKEGLKK